MTRLRSSSFGEARSARSRGRHGILRACLVVAAQLRRRAFTTAAAVMIGGGTSALAAQAARLEGDTSIMDGAMLGILAMLAITFAMQGAFVGFFFYLRKRAKRIADIDLDAEELHAQRAAWVGRREAVPRRS